MDSKETFVGNQTNVSSFRLELESLGLFCHEIELQQDNYNVNLNNINLPYIAS